MHRLFGIQIAVLTAFGRKSSPLSQYERHLSRWDHKLPNSSQEPGIERIPSCEVCFTSKIIMVIPSLTTGTRATLLVLIGVLCSLQIDDVQAWSMQNPSQKSSAVAESKFGSSHGFSKVWKKPSPVLASIATAAVILTSSASPALADEYGVEREAPTLFTGETVEVNMAPCSFSLSKERFWCSVDFYADWFFFLCFASFLLHDPFSNTPTNSNRTLPILYDTIANY